VVLRKKKISTILLNFLKLFLIIYQILLNTGAPLMNLLYTFPKVIFMVFFHLEKKDPKLAGTVIRNL
jgi:hypothetical protein